MHDVEAVGLAEHVLAFQDVVRQMIVALEVKPQRTRRLAFQMRVRAGIAAGEERHFMALPHLFFGQIGNDALGAAV
jgi:hypothetical protein